MNTITILRSRDQIEDAPMAVLVATYNALTGRTPDGEGTKRSISKFESREVGKRRVDTAMMAAADADAHLGVPKGANGEVKTAEELEAKADEKGAAAPDMSHNGSISFPDGTLANALQKQAEAAPGPITPRPRKDTTPKKERDPAAPRAPKFTRVSFAPADKASSKVRPDSARGVVLAAMTTLCGRDDKPEGVWVEVSAIEARIGFDPRPAIQKLVVLGHVFAADAEPAAAA